MEIGQADGAEAAYSLYSVGDVQFMNAGAIAVANGFKEVRIYDGLGTYIRTLGGLGDGPSEFGFLHRMYSIDNDGLAVLDLSRRRVVRFDVRGNLQSSYSISGVRINPRAGAAIFGDGRMVVLAPSLILNSEARQVRRPSEIIIVHQDTHADTVGEVPGESLVFEGPRYFFMPMGPASYLARWGNGFVFTSGDNDVVDFFDRDGKLLKRVETGRRGELLTPEIVAEWVEQRREGLDVRGIGNEDLIFPFGIEPDWPERLPVYTGLFRDGNACVWARRFQVPGDSVKRFDVISQNAGLVAEVQVLGSLYVRDVTQHSVATIVRDSLGVERVRLYHLDRGPSRICEEPPQ